MAEAIYNGNCDLMDSIKCAVCRKRIKRFNECVQIPPKMAIVCKSCWTCFDNDELAEMLDLFELYGGYFNFRRRDIKRIDLKKLLSELVRDMSRSNVEPFSAEFYSKALHFLYVNGLTPNYFSKLFEGMNLK